MTIRRLPALLAALALSASLAACTASGGADGAAQQNAAGSTADSGSARSLITEDAAPQAATLDGAQANVPTATENAAGRAIIRNGNVTLAVDDPAGSAPAVREVAESLGGYVESQNVGDAASSGANLALRVPSDRFDEAFDSLAKLGTVLGENRSSTDVTEQQVDLQARIDALQASIDRLTQLMSGAANTADLLEAESALTQRQAELDSLQSQLSALEGQIDESSIFVSLTTDNVLPGGPANFWEGLIAGLQSVGVIGAGLLVVLGVLLPWLVIAAVITLVAIWIVRNTRGRRGRRNAAVPQAQAAQAHAAQAPATPYQQPQPHQAAQPPSEPTPGA